MVVLVIGFSVWVFFFREKEDVQAHNRLSELIDYKESLGIEEKMIELRNLNYLNGNKDSIITTSSAYGTEILHVRTMLCSEDKIVGTSSDGGISYTYSSYYRTDEIIDDIISYYLPYTTGNKVNGKTLKNLKNNVKDYIESLKDINYTIDELIAFQNIIEGSNIEMEALRNRYNALQSKYRKNLGDASNVIVTLMEYIDVSVYSDKMYIDCNSALYDAFARMLNVYSTVDANLINDYAHDVNVVIERIEDIEEGTSIYSEQYTEYDFLSSYNTLFNNYKDVLNYVFSAKNLEKKQMAAGSHLDKVLEKSQTSVITTLNVLGYVGV